MISETSLEGFADIIIRNDGYFHILVGYKALTISAVKLNIHTDN